MVGTFLILFVLLITILLLPVFIIWVLRKLKERGFRKTANTIKLACILIAVFLAYLVYIAIYPPDSLYISDFEDLGILFPKNAKILTKDATYPDIHGHYQGCCAIEMGTRDFSDMETKFPANSQLDTIADAGPFNLVMKNYSNSNVHYVNTTQLKRAGKIHLVFLNDNKTIVFVRSSW